MRKVVVWFLVCLLLAVYVRARNIVPGEGGQILGAKERARFPVLTK